MSVLFNGNNRSLWKYVTTASLFFACTNTYAFSNSFGDFTAFLMERGCPHWYVGGNLGVSHLFDDPAPNAGSSVDQNGPGWSADVGFQLTKWFGAELGYIQYHFSRENIDGFNLAKTEHYAVYLAATAQYPLFCTVNLLAKLGAAYSYANKIFVFGPAASSGAGAPFAALGLLFNVSNNVDFIAQWSRAWGNDYTGSSDLYSLGVQFNIF